MQLEVARVDRQAPDLVERPHTPRRIVPRSLVAPPPRSDDGYFSMRAAHDARRRIDHDFPLRLRRVVSKQPGHRLDARSTVAIARHAAPDASSIDSAGNTHRLRWRLDT